MPAHIRAVDMAAVNGISADHQRGVQVQGEYLRYLRRVRGWTQQDLAERAGYCDRLIRKAEKDGFLLPETIEVLAEALSTPESPVEPSDLWLLPRTKVDLFLQLLRGEKPLTEITIAAIATKQVTVRCKAPEYVPFAGCFEGRSGLKQWLHAFRNSIADDQSQVSDQAIMVDQQQAFLHTCWIFEKANRRSKAIDLDIRMDLSMGQIAKMVAVCDTLDFVEFFKHGAKRRNPMSFAKKPR